MRWTSPRRPDSRLPPSRVPPVNVPADVEVVLRSMDTLRGELAAARITHRAAAEGVPGASERPSNASGPRPRRRRTSSGGSANSARPTPRRSTPTALDSGRWPMRSKCLSAPETSASRITRLGRET